MKLTEHKYYITRGINKEIDKYYIVDEMYFLPFIFGGVCIYYELLGNDDHHPFNSYEEAKEKLKKISLQ